MKRFCCLLLSLLMLRMDASAETWRSIAEIREETPARWTQTYETPWRTIAIDAAIEMPQVEAFPILLVRKMPAAEQSLLPAGAKIRYNMPGMFQCYTGNAEYAMKSNTMFRSIDYYPGPELPDVRAEDCSFMPQDALTLAHEQAARLYGLDSGHFRLDETLVYSRIWQFRGKKSNPTYTRPVTEEGSYTIRLEQLLEGIPYFACSEVGADGRSGRWLTDARLTVAHRGRDGYMVLASLWRVEKVVHADVPLLSFAGAKAAFEKEILSGRLRSVETLTLGYAPYADPEDADLFWLLPVWYVRGGYAEDPRREFKPWLNPDGTVADDGIKRREVVFEAQRGALMEGGKRVNAPAIRLWDSLAGE